MSCLSAQLQDVIVEVVGMYSCVIGLDLLVGEVLSMGPVLSGTNETSLRCELQHRESSEIFWRRTADHLQVRVRRTQYMVS